MMKYDIEINGIMVNATYTDENIKEIFIPILKKLTEMQKEKGSRVVAFLAAPPGSGKSTLLSFLKYLSMNTEGVSPITTIGMDGFHRYQDYLINHTMVRDGKEIQMVKVKGAPETFDIERLRERIERVAAGEECGWPDYNRMKHNPEEDAIFVIGDIVMLEGNYLLLDEAGWKDLKNFADLTIKISADENLLRKRLVDRKVKSGSNLEQAEAFVDFSDMYNVRTCVEKSGDADFEIRIRNDETYEILSI